MRTLGGKRWLLGRPWSEGDAAKNTSEESKASGNSQLKTPLSSRELNSNVRVLRGRKTSAGDGKMRGDGDRCVRIFK